jgi:hypothetical protein
MAISRNVFIKDDCVNLTVDRVDQGSIEPSGYIKFLTASDTEIVRIYFNNPGYSDSFFGVATALGLPISATSIGTDEIGTKFSVHDRDNNFLWGGTIGLIGSGADLIVASVNFTANTLVRIEAPLTYTSP